MDINEQLSIGQTFSIDNPPFEVFSEEWEIVELSYPNITFSYTKYWVRDMAYIPISTTDTVVGLVLKGTDYGLVIELKKFPYLDAGLLLKGNKAMYLSDLDLEKYH
ncbi:MAG TPA: hypothetical protein DDZ80_09020 [Cyanobacteria bacterium UBA8803]|nr:hypothetical protein [Cyanobacteria bacterium UBA9273]HBL58639.1 hypothetical protein [Cyanobacteria bacterium UBA8803]